jgi:hypothetical protein
MASSASALAVIVISTSSAIAAPSRAFQGAIDLDRADRWHQIGAATLQASLADRLTRRSAWLPTLWR